jgi:hypothetical protein
MTGIQYRDHWEDKKMERLKQGLVIAGIMVFVMMIIPMDYAQEQSEGQQAEQKQAEPQPKKSKASKSRSIEATADQKSQIRHCIVTAQRVRKFCREVERLTHARALPPEAFGHKVDEVLKDSYLLLDHHEKFVSGLNEEQKEQLEDRLEKMDSFSLKISEYLEKLEEEIAKPKYYRRDVVLITEDIELDTEDWQRIYRGIVADMGMKLTGR